MIDLADQVKSLVTMREVAERYGFHPDRSGYICCPFHNEKTGSMKLYDGRRGFHCFGCGAGGSVIDFVMRLFEIPFFQAVLRINADFSLGLTWDRPDPAAQSAVRAAARRREQREAELERMEDQYRKLAAEHRYWWDALQYFSPSGEDAGSVHPLYAEAMKRQPYLEYLLDGLEEMMRGVKADRERKDVTAGQYSSGSPGQTA